MLETTLSPPPARQRESMRPLEGAASKMPPGARSALACGAAIAVVAAFFIRPLLGGWQFYHSDAHALVYPLKEMLQSRLREGALPLWDPHSLCGYPVIGSYVSAVFLPQNILFVLLPLGHAFALFTAAKHVAAALFMFLFLRRAGLERIPSAAGAALFALSGPLLSISDFHAFSYECFPLMLWSWWRVIDEPPGGRRWLDRAWALAVLAFTLSFFHGDLQTVYAGGILALLLPLAVIGWKPPLWPAATARWALLAAASSLLAAVQLLPAAALLGESTRTALPSAERLAHSVGWSQLVDLAWPAPSAAAASGEFIAFPYLGLAAILLAVAGGAMAASRGGSRRRLALFLAGAALVTLLLALGGNAPLLEPLSSLLPGMKLFRYPQKWLGLLAFLVSALAALGLVELMRTPARRWVWAIGAAAVIDVFLCGSPFLKERLVEAEAFRPEIPTRPEKRVDGYSPHDRLLRLPTSGAFAGLRMGGRQAPASEAELRAEMRRSAIAWNIETLLGNNASRAGARRVSGISSFSFRRMEILWAEAARRGEVARLADILAARWILTSPADAEEFRSREHLRGLLPPDPPAAAWRTPRGDLEIYRRPTALPRAFFVREGFAVDGDRAAIDALLDPRNDPRRCVILEAQNEMRQGARAGKPSPGGRGSGRSGDADADPPQVAFIEDREEVIVLDVSGVEAGGGYLVLADSYDAGWEAMVDGRSVEIHRANCFARAVAVPPGDCRIVMRYRPLSLRLGALASAAALLLILPALLRRPRRRA